ncbi:MAG: response regulator, partial [Bacteroidota bacterium]
GYRPDIIVLDLGLPGQNGKSFLLELKKQEYLAEIPIIVLSGDDKSDTKINMLKAGAEDFIVKPFNPEELEIKLERLSTEKRKKIHPQYLTNTQEVLGIKLKE